MMRSIILKTLPNKNLSTCDRKKGNPCPQQGDFPAQKTVKIKAWNGANLAPLAIFSHRKSGLINEVVGTYLRTLK